MTPTRWQFYRVLPSLLDRFLASSLARTTILPNFACCLELDCSVPGLERFFIELFPNSAQPLLGEKGKRAFTYHLGILERSISAHSRNNRKSNRPRQSEGNWKAEPKRRSYAPPNSIFVSSNRPSRWNDCQRGTAFLASPDSSHLKTRNQRRPMAHHPTVQCDSMKQRRKSKEAASFFLSDLYSSTPLFRCCSGRPVVLFLSLSLSLSSGTQSTCSASPWWGCWRRFPR